MGGAVGLEPRCPGDGLVPPLPALPTRAGSKAYLETALCLLSRNSVSS